MKKLVIDLGHGGSDSGAVGQNKTYESNIVLAIGKELDNLLKELDLEVKFTRLSDIYLSLSERSKIANSFNAGYFLSIHINSSSDNSVRGVEVWEYSNSNSNLNKFSNGLCNDISNTFNIRNRGIKFSKDLSVLRNTKMPACLLEVDFISNIEAEKNLINNSNIKSIASIIRDNIVELFGLKNVENTKLYKVCIGAYRQKNNAVNQVNIAKERGFFDAYII